MVMAYHGNVKETHRYPLWGIHSYRGGGGGGGGGGANTAA